MDKQELEEEIGFLRLGQTMSVLKSQAVRDLQAEGKLRIRAIEPFFYIVEKPQQKKGIKC